VILTVAFLGSLQVFGCVCNSAESRDLLVVPNQCRDLLGDGGVDFGLTCEDVLEDGYLGLECRDFLIAAVEWI
jgi:hypothetical protein